MNDFDQWNMSISLAICSLLCFTIFAGVYWRWSTCLLDDRIQNRSSIDHKNGAPLPAIAAATICDWYWFVVNLPPTRVTIRSCSTSIVIAPPYEYQLFSLIWFNYLLFVLWIMCFSSKKIVALPHTSPQTHAFICLCQTISIVIIWMAPFPIFNAIHLRCACNYRWIRSDSVY